MNVGVCLMMDSHFNGKHARIGEILSNSCRLPTMFYCWHESCFICELPIIDLLNAFIHDKIRLNLDNSLPLRAHTVGVPRAKSRTATRGGPPNDDHLLPITPKAGGPLSLERPMNGGHVDETWIPLVPYPRHSRL